MSENNEQINFKEISQKIHQTGYVDGFVFIFLGIILMITAGVVNFTLASLGLVIVSFVVFIPLTEFLRRRFTYPRMGHFKIKTEKPSEIFPGMILFVVALIVVSLVIIFILEGGNVDEFYDNIWEYWPIIFGLIMFGPSLDIVDKTGQVRFYGMGIFSTLFGMFIFFLDFPHPRDGFTVYLLILGLISIIIGFIIFIRFIQLYSIIPEEKERTNNELEG